MMLWLDEVWDGEEGGAPRQEMPGFSEVGKKGLE